MKLARSLHDEIGDPITGMIMYLERIKQLVPVGGEADDLITELLESIDEVNKTVKNNYINMNHPVKVFFGIVILQDSRYC